MRTSRVLNSRSLRMNAFVLFCKRDLDVVVWGEKVRGGWWWMESAWFDNPPLSVFSFPLGCRRSESDYLIGRESVVDRSGSEKKQATRSIQGDDARVVW